MDIDGIAVAADFIGEIPPGKIIFRGQLIVATDAPGFPDAHQRAGAGEEGIGVGARLKLHQRLLNLRREFPPGHHRRRTLHGSVPSTSHRWPAFHPTAARAHEKAAKMTIL